MATATRTTAAKKATAKKAAAPAAKKAAPKPAEVEAPAKQEVTFGVADLCAHVAEKLNLDKVPTTREMRTLIRKMARDESGRVNREIIPGNRSRYDWSGPNDPEVKAIVKAFADGELEADKQEKLAALKASSEAKRAAKKAAKEAEEAGDEDEAEEDEELELEDEDED